MGLSSAVQWWEDSQLRVLALGSLAVQCYLALFASARKKHIQPLFRFSIWLAYLGGDALAIYALAALFNRQRKVQVQHSSANNGSHGHELEVLWAPILLMHLGGRINISAYNIEDNELWRRHILTAVAQVTVAIYVLSTSWSPSADKRLLVAAILLFVIGFFKCFDKPIALKRASFSSIVTTFRPAPRSSSKTTKRELELEEYIQKVRQLSQLGWPQYVDEGQLSTPDKLFVDYAYVYRDRLTKLRSFWLLSEESVYDALRIGLSQTFNLIYSKVGQWGDENRETPICTNCCSNCLSLSYLLLPVMPIGFFHGSHKEGYRRSDITVTFLLLYITYILEISSYLTVRHFLGAWSDGVAQHNLIGFLASNRRHARLVGIMEFLQLDGLLHSYFGSKPCHSAKGITRSVREYAKAGWMSYITDIESYWRFSDSRGYCALERNGGEEILLGSIEKPFDESIILWHVATYFCFYYSKGTSPDSECPRMCREISNYMMHLLFANPEMLLPGSRRNLFTVAYEELVAMLQGDDDDLSLLDERGLTLKIISKAGSAEGFIRDSWILARELMRLGDEKKMWEVIKSVWIEMLSFSASRCRGYLHAKSLGSGGEFLSYISLLMSHAGLETYAERQQRVHLRLPKEERVKIAKQGRQLWLPWTGRMKIGRQQIQETANNQATTPLASEVNRQLEEQDDAASTSPSRVECVTPDPVVKIVVSP